MDAVVVEVDTQRNLSDANTPSKDTECTSAERLRIAASWPGLAFTVLGCGSLTYGLYASSTAFCIAAAGFGGPGIALLLGVCVSYCFEQAENDEEIALVAGTNTSAPVSMNSSGPTAIPSTDENPVYKQALQDWHEGGQRELEEKLKRKSLQVSLSDSITFHAPENTSTQTDSTTVSNTDMQHLRRRTAPNPKSSRNLKIRSGEQNDDRKPVTRARTTSHTVRNSIELGNSTHSGDEATITQGDGILDDLSETEQEYQLLLKQHYQSLDSSVRPSESSKHDSTSDSY